jgi:hypothetical protein
VLAVLHALFALFAHFSHSRIRRIHAFAHFSRIASCWPCLPRYPSYTVILTFAHSSIPEFVAFTHSRIRAFPNSRISSIKSSALSVESFHRCPGRIGVPACSVAVQHLSKRLSDRKSHTPDASAVQARTRLRQGYGAAGAYTPSTCNETGMRPLTW